MRILLSVPSLSRGKGGAEKTASDLANAWDETGHKVGVIFNANGGAHPAYPLNEGITRLPSRYSSQQPSVLAAEERRVRAFRPDIVIIFYADISILWQLPFFKRLECPIAVQECTSPLRGVRNLIKGMERLGADYDFKAAFLLRQAIFASVEGIRLVLPSYLNSVAPPLRYKTAAFYNCQGVPERPSPAEPKKGKRIVCVGGLKDFNKNGVVAARAFASLAAIYPGWELHFYGVNRFANEIERLNRLPSVQGRIIQRGLVDEMEPEYRAAEFSVLCSFEEGNPNAVNESMLAGIPTIGFEDCEGYRGLVTDQVDGLVISREPEVKSLADAMAMLMDNPTLRNRLAHGAYQTMLERQDKKKYLRNWSRILANADLQNGDGKQSQPLIHALTPLLNDAIAAFRR